MRDDVNPPSSQISTMKRSVSLKRAAVVLVGALSSCAPKDDVKKAEAEVDLFHRHWNESEFTQIYNEAHNGFRSAQSASKTIGALQRSRNLHGAFKSAKQRSVEITFEHIEKDVTLKYECAYEHGVSEEAFTYRISAGKPLLLQYYILSPESAAKLEAEEARRKAEKKSR